MTAGRLGLPLAIVLGVVVRVPFWHEALRTPVDGDTAIIGLMARHPLHSVTMWGQPYGSPLEAWWAAPWIALTGGGAESLRLAYFLLGLGLIPCAYLLARALDVRAALPAAVLLACPPPYFLLLSSLPPPMYPSALLLSAGVLLLALAVAARWSSGREARGALAALGALSGLALWTHLMTAAPVAAALGWLAWRRRGRLLSLWPAAAALAAASAPWWTGAVADPRAFEVVSVSGRRAGLVEHLASTLPRVHVPLGGLLGTHVPLVADDPEHLVRAAPAAAVVLVLVYALGVGHAARRAWRARVSGDEAALKAGLLLLGALLVLIAFPFPLRASPASIRFLTPAYLPLAALLTWTAAAAAGPRRAWTLVLVLAAAHAATGARLLAAWRTADRERPPFLLVDLRPAREALESQGVRRAYASYGPAYRLTFETRERIVASQPWNERFLHHPLPYLDEVRFAKNVAWVLTQDVPTDLPAPRAFEEALERAGGAWRRTVAGRAVVYHAFVPPFGADVVPLRAAGTAGDADVLTALRPDAAEATTFVLPEPRPLDALTLVAADEPLRLLRSMDVAVSADGRTFEVVARRRRREERDFLRWVNGHPQYVVDHDLVAVPLAGRTVAAVRVAPVLSTDPWTLSEVLLHPAASPASRAPWDEWLDPNLDWAGRRRALETGPRPGREDWHYRRLLAARAKGPTPGR